MQSDAQTKKVWNNSGTQIGKCCFRKDSEHSTRNGNYILVIITSKEFLYTDTFWIMLWDNNGIKESWYRKETLEERRIEVCDK